MEKLKMHSPNLVAQNIEQLAALFPNCVTESRGKDGELKRAIDFDLLKQELSAHIVEGPQERYQLNWPGKREALLTANAPIAKTLRPCHEESVNFDTTQNLFIEGDNLDALKLLQNTYLEKIKLIYIDPPYNTGRDFIYDDDYSEDVGSYLLQSNQVNELGARLVTNSEANGRFHSDWLSMIYARLRLARNLLKEDGVIFLSIDDHEVDNLRKVCSEVFGEDNFIAQIIWQKVYAPKNTADWFSEDHDYVLIYAKSKAFWRPQKLARTPEMEARYKNPDNDVRGPWKAENMSARNRYDAGIYPVMCPSGREISGPPTGNYWRINMDKFLELDRDNRIWWGQDGNNTPAVKKFLSEVSSGRTPQTLWFYKEVGHTQDAKKALLKYVQFEHTENVLNSVKPVELLQRVLQLTGQPNDGDIVLDFFSGSASTAHAVLKQNAEDGGNRRFIGVQIAEPLPKPERGMASIFDMGLKRIRSVAEEIRAQTQEDKTSCDVGFRVFKIDSSNMTDVYYNPDAIIQDDLFAQVDNIKADRTEEDLLFQVMLDWGVDLMAPILRQTIDGKSVFFVDADAQHQHGALVACFDKTGGIDDAFIRQLAAFSPLRLVFRDAGFASDAVKINAEQLLKQLSPLTEIKAI